MELISHLSPQRAEDDKKVSVIWSKRGEGIVYGVSHVMYVSLQSFLTLRIEVST